jgi:hypothetical protein
MVALSASTLPMTRGSSPDGVAVNPVSACPNGQPTA